jgi:hypothetical protein
MVLAEVACSGYQKWPIAPSSIEVNRDVIAQYAIALGELQQAFRRLSFCKAYPIGPCSRKTASTAGSLAVVEMLLLAIFAPPARSSHASCA